MGPDVRPLLAHGLSLLAVIAVVPRFAGEARDRLAQVARPVVEVVPVALDPRDPARRRLGALTYLGGVALRVRAQGAGGYSALAVDGRYFALVSDGGAVLRFEMGADWRVRNARQAPLPGGPGTGWTKRDRDSESLAVRGDDWWVGFERTNAIWRYVARSDGQLVAVRGRAPAAMARWRENGGAEGMTRLPDGRFVVLEEGRTTGNALGPRMGLVFPRDPTDPGSIPFRFTYVARPGGFAPADVAALPDGRLVVLERRVGLPNDWGNRLAIVPAGALRPGAIVRGATLAMLAPPLVSDNFEGLAIGREGGATALWLVSDDNGYPWQRTLLLKFRLDR